ncbi:L-histidine N(alpha)-methyltransferase [Labilibacter sediminis]|nr:L-histidine N(alpha)-methyltransferase [Labilibacter sediminis]
MNYTNDDITVKEKLKLVNYLPEIGIKRIQKEIITGLQSTPKYISPKFFYDEAGSKLFKEITQLKEYYPTRTEKTIITNIYPKLNLNVSKLNIVELGSGDHSKISLFLKQIPENTHEHITYYPIDISQSSIKDASFQLHKEFPLIHISGIVADFIHQLKSLSFEGPCLFCFFGSTIGNLSPYEVKEFMDDLSSIMKPDDHLLMGMDLEKDIQTLEKAYNDTQNTTSSFNKNILNVVNSLTGSTFNTNHFNHHAFYNSYHRRIEMHLIAKKYMLINIPSTEPISIAMGESILTEYSHKFHPDSIEQIGKAAQLKLNKIHTDDKEWFSLVHFTKK